MSVEVAVLDTYNYADIPEMLRVIAAEIENGEHGGLDDIKNVVVLIRGQCHINYRSVGPQSDYYYTLATLALAQHDMME